MYVPLSANKKKKKPNNAMLSKNIPPIYLLFTMTMHDNIRFFSVV